MMGSMRSSSRLTPPSARAELDHAVHRVQADPAEERGERVPVEANAPAREQRDSGHEEAEVEDELHHPLGPLRERLGRVEVVEAREVDEREEDEERESDHRGPGEASVVLLEAIPREEHEEDGREDVRERQRAGELPLQLVERDREDRQEEQPVEHGWASTRSRASGSRTAAERSSRARVPLTCGPRARAWVEVDRAASPWTLAPISSSGRPRERPSSARTRRRALGPGEADPSDALQKVGAVTGSVEATVHEVGGLALRPGPDALLAGRKPRGPPGHRDQRVGDELVRYQRKEPRAARSSARRRPDRS